MVSQFTVTVPTTRNVSTPLTASEAEAFRDEVVRRLSEVFGGATAIQGVGGYVANDGSLVKETVYIVSSYGQRSAAATEAVFGIAAWLAATLSQESVLVVIDNRVSFVTDSGEVTPL